MQTRADSLSHLQGRTAEFLLYQAPATPLSAPQDTAKQGWHTSTHQRLYLAAWTLASPTDNQGLLLYHSSLRLLVQKQLTLRSLPVKQYLSAATLRPATYMPTLYIHACRNLGVACSIVPAAALFH